MCQFSKKHLFLQNKYYQHYFSVTMTIKASSAARGSPHQNDTDSLLVRAQLFNGMCFSSLVVDSTDEASDLHQE